jgi:DNA-directed RNA polymerase sigma subunit (sigma70/sigma32)
MNDKPSKKKHFEQYSNDLYWLADSIAVILAENKKDNTSQKQQVDELILAEKLFKEEILRYKYSTQVYKKFINKIRYIDRNILYSKVYFRENSETFSRDITPCLKAEDPEGLKKFNINFNLIQFIRENWRGPLGSKAEKLYARVERARRVLQENNLPLAINVAKLFYRKVPKSPHASLMDLIAVSIMGLTSGVDKYTGDKDGNYSEVFRSVLMGRGTGNAIKLYSETPLHFYPSDRKILYKANSIRGRQGITDINELTAAVNAAFKADKKQGLSSPKNEITVSELQALLNAASILSVEVTADENNYTAYDYTIDENANAEERLINTETNEKIGKLIKTLPPIHRKVLRLKGINF